MADIQVKPDNENLTLKFSFTSPQQFFYNIAMVNRERNQQVYHASGKWDGQTEFSLGEADELIGLYLIIYWNIIDPQGAGNNFSAIAAVNQNGNSCISPQLCSGQSNSTASFLTTIGKFVVPNPLDDQEKML
jgi:hypothetical protein